MVKLLAGIAYQINCLVFLFGCVESVRHNDICAVSYNTRLYLEFQNSGFISASNLSVSANNSVENQNATFKECHVELITCPSCIIQLNFSYLNLLQKCNRGNSECHDGFLQIYEHPFENVSKRKLCCKTSDFIIKTQTRSVTISLFYTKNISHALTMEYKSLRNRQIFKYDPANETKTTKYSFTSPYFPAFYLHDLSSEYVISCKNTSDDCRIRLIFTDFQLAMVSIMEFFDWNGQRLEVVTGARFRPPILISSGPSLTVRFYANSGTGLGFKGIYTFVTERSEENSTEPITDCGGFVDNLGGAITMMNMVENGTRYYDCFWIIRPPENYMHFKSHLYLKIITFSEMQKNSKIVVHQGTTSNGKILEIIRTPSADTYAMNPREHILPMTIGFYVRLKGFFEEKSRLAIVYSAFSYKDCFMGSDYLCENQRCIPRQLTCDGFDHCGDNSDEPTSCYSDSSPDPLERQWYLHKPNYLFPKIDPYTDLKTASLVFIMGSLGLVGLISALFILLYRINTRARHEQSFQDHLQNISDLLEEEMIDTESITDEPPTYEAPPDYDEVIKIGFETNEDEKFKPRRPTRKCKTRRSRKNKSRPSSRSNGNINTEESNNQDLPTSSAILVETEAVQSQESNVDVPVVADKPVRFIRKCGGHNTYHYLSDKSISSNVKQALRRRWHSQDEVTHLRTDEICSTITKDKLVKLKYYLMYGAPPRYETICRETASDSELLKDNAEECECEGACGCASQPVRGDVGSRKRLCKFNSR